MLYISNEKTLARLLRVTRNDLRETLEHADDYYDLLRLYDPAKPDKPRDLVNVKGKLRRLQTLFYRNVLLRRLPISPYSHGGVRGRSIHSNAAIHFHSSFVFKADISNFYPSILQPKVYRLFRDRLACTHPVAALCKRLCTFEHRLDLGLITSPILADQVVQTMDRRIGILCANCGLEYSRFVDDITISGKYDIERSGIPKLVAQIFAQNGLRANPKKNVFGLLIDGISITGIRRISRGNVDVKKEYAEELARVLDDMEVLSNRQTHDRSRPFYTRDQIRGRIQFVMSVNPGRAKRLLQRYRDIKWTKVELAAHEQRLVIS